ncbi:MAG: transglutaminase family protein [Polyangiales bacterium]
MDLENTRPTRVAITHRFEQRFERPLRLSTHWLRLRPAPQTRARITAYSLQVHAQGHFLNWVRDPFENYLARLDLPEPVPSLGIDLELIAELTPVNPFDFLADYEAANHPFKYSEHSQKELAPYLALPEVGPRLRAFLATLERDEVSTVERLSTINRQVHEALTLSAAGRLQCGEPVDPEGSLSKGSGSAWQLAWLLTVGLRELGIASRFVCGQRITLAADDAELRQDHVILHSWSEAFVPGAGWIGLDPSAGVFTTETYIPFASAPDPLRVRPIVGEREREAGRETLTETLTVKRLTPQLTASPFSPSHWSDIRALGQHVDRDLNARGLTPSLSHSLTFSSAHPVGWLEWNTHALGDNKRATAEALLANLRKRLAPSGVPHLGQGEWFSGEPLPRWRLTCVGRTDGVPLWRNPDRLGWGRVGNTIRPPQDAEQLAKRIARALGVQSEHVVPALEDPLHARWSARNNPLPTPSDEELNDPAARRKLAARLSETRGDPTGYVLPLRWDHAAQRWESGVWAFRRGGLHLVPGDSPLGYRLPLASLQIDEETTREAQLERSPFEPRGELPELYAETHLRLQAAAQSGEQTRARETAPARTPRTALCVQIRAGQLYVFLPPVSHAEHYVALVTAIETAAEAGHTTVILEGYEPPEDPRLSRFVLEPDAGVLRLHLPQAAAWPARLEVLQAAYDEGARVGLTPERVTSEGARIPAGGGGRLTLGGTEPAKSPFLQRPEILRALITYWQRHPSLSYLFSGRLIGAGGSAPRPDEGRDEALYELSIGLARLPSGESATPWQADRALRHLLVDLSGDLKRAEIRSDQLFSPDRASLQQGRIFIQSFETAPHPEVAALEELLVLALLGHFARRPDDAALAPWGTALHDRFMLPQVLYADLASVLADLNASGYPFQLVWFDQLAEQRFPVLGKTPIGTITLELRQAHEPWPLLAEEVAAGGVSRFIDAANERMQVRLTGLTPGRYVLACNGDYVPLQSTGTHGEFVAGVRYKVANPPATLHPTIPPVGRLVFDLIDLWTGRTVGGATYLPPQPELWGPIGNPVLPPTPPVGDEPAPVRLPPLPHVSLAPLGATGRFLPYGSQLGPMPAPAPFYDPEYPYLLDLTHRA